MSDQRGRRIRPAPTPRRVGEPNVLSNQAMPNRLSTMGTGARSASPKRAPATGTASGAEPVTAGPTASTGRPAPPSTGGAAPRARRSLTVNSLIFIGFLVFTVMRFINSGGADDADPLRSSPPTSVPKPSLIARPTVDSSPGKVVFGESTTHDGCDLEKGTTRFRTGIDVYWQAEAARTVQADETVVFLATYDGVEVDREKILPDPDVGEWAILCAGRAVPGYRAGLYRVEIWDETEQELLSSGEYTKVANATPPTPKPVTPGPATEGPP
jgi:hypothetical protein